MILDSSTLFTVAISITGLLGVFLVVLWLQERSVRALAWWGAAYLVGASAVTLWGAQGQAQLVGPDLPNALLFIACGMIWTGARLFHGRPVVAAGVLAGAFVWFLAVQFERFAGSGQARVVLSSLIIASYAFGTAFELRRERRRDLMVLCRSISIPLLHAAVFLAPIPFSLMLAAGPSADALFALFALETVLYVVGTAFIVVGMAKEHVALVHKTAAMTDVLTGLFNRRAFLEAAERLLAQRARKRQPVSVLVFDLDHFKSINDRFGHATGDEALKVFARTASANLRASDVVGRLGGEEFAAILPSGEADAAMVAERLRTAFQSAGVEIGGHRIGATVSIGVATVVPPAAIDALLSRADIALYRAKSNGRNRVEAATGGTAAMPASPPPAALPDGTASRPALAATNPALQ